MSQRPGFKEYDARLEIGGDLPSGLVKSAVLRIPETARKRGLDLGAGVRLRHTKYMLASGFPFVEAVDKNPEVLNLAEPGIEFVIGRIEKYRPTYYFDLVVCYNVLLWLPEREIKRLILKVHQVLRPQGLFVFNVFTTQDEYSRRGREIRRAGFTKEGVAELVDRFTRVELTRDRKTLPYIGGTKTWHTWEVIVSMG